MNLSRKLANCRILIVDDEPANSTLLKCILERGGFKRVSAEADPVTALDRFERKQPDIMITDLHMPKLHGLELIATIHERTPKGAFVPIVAVTADSNPELEQQALALGVQDFLTKPFQQLQVCLRIRNLLHTRLMHVELSRRNDRLNFLALHDTLTGLPNRRLAGDRLTQAIATSDRSGLATAAMLLDLDNFKSINDTYGHDVGDYVLREVAARLTANLRAGDTVARWGGDEFLLLFTQLQSGDVMPHVTERLQEAVHGTYTMAGKSVRVEFSSGIAVYPGSASAADELVKNADCALYRAKSLGKNRCALFRRAPDVTALPALAP